MTKPEDAFLRFACPRCLARLKARTSQAGRRLMCPRCQYMLVVPDAGQIAASSVRREEYALRPAGEQAASRPGIVVECPVCRTRMDASEEQVGQEVVCPDCGTAVLVRPPEAPVQQERRAVQVEGYALLDESYQPAESRSSARPIYIPVRCPLCDTLMHGTEDQVGQHLLCPDCYTPVVVPPPAEAPVKPTHRVDDEYALQEEIERPAAAPRVEKKPLIPVVCRLCEARMYARPEQAGELICCPDCGTPVVVPRPEAATPTPDMAATAAGEYGVGEAAERPEYHAPVNLRVARIEPGEQELVDRSETAGIVRVRPAVARWPMFSGVFSFPFYSGTRPRVVGLAAGLLVGLPLIVFSLILMKAPNVGAATAVPWVGSMVLMGTGGLLCVGWAVVASGFLVAVVRDSAEGTDQIEDWPELMMFSDWAFDFFYIFNSLAVSVLLGVAVAQILGFVGPASWLAVPVSVFLVFPIALISMLEADSVLKPLSLRVLGSLFSAWWAWGLFYVEAAVLVAAFAFLSALVLLRIGQWGILLLGILSVPILMIYFRLLGRVAWCCGQVAGEEDEDEQEDDRAAQEEATTSPATSPKPSEPAPRAKSILNDDWSV